MSVLSREWLLRQELRKIVQKMSTKVEFAI